MLTSNVVIVGHVCIDHNTTESSSYTSWGSSVLYIAQHLQAQYLAVPLVVSNYGPDILPYLPVADILPDRPNKAKTLLYENDTRSTPRVWKAHNTAFADAPELTPEVIVALRRADIVIVATLLPNYSVSYVKELLSYVRPQSLTVLCPQGYLRQVQPGGLVMPRDFEEADQLVPLFDLVVFSEDDIPLALEAAKTWQVAAPKTRIIITQGSEGATIIQAGKAEHISTVALPPEEIVDSVGCGDVFAATTAYEYHATHDLPRAVRVAHEAARSKLLHVPST